VSRYEYYRYAVGIGAYDTAGRHFYRLRGRAEMIRVRRT